MVVERQCIAEMLEQNFRRSMCQSQIVGVVAAGHDIVVDPDWIGTPALVDGGSGPPVRLFADTGLAARVAPRLRRPQVEIVTSIGHVQSLVSASRASIPSPEQPNARFAHSWSCREHPRRQF